MQKFLAASMFGLRLYQMSSQHFQCLQVCIFVTNEKLREQATIFLHDEAFLMMILETTEGLMRRRTRGKIGSLPADLRHANSRNLTDSGFSMCSNQCSTHEVREERQVLGQWQRPLTQSTCVNSWR